MVARGTPGSGIGASESTYGRFLFHGYRVALLGRFPFAGVRARCRERVRPSESNLVVLLAPRERREEFGVLKSVSGRARAEPYCVNLNMSRYNGESSLNVALLFLQSDNFIRNALVKLSTRTVITR